MPTTPRRRHRVLLPSYAPGCTVEAERGWNDRIKIAFDRGSIQVPSGRFLDAYLRTLARGGWVHRASTQDFAHKVSVDHRSGLFTARMHISRKHHDPEGRWSIKCMLEVNPIRMFAACGCDLERLRTVNVETVSELSGDLRTEIAAETYDGNDNFIPDSLVSRARRVRPAEVTRAAIEAAWRMMERAFVPVGSGEAQQIDDQSSFWEPDDRIAGLEEAERYALPPLTFDFAWDRWALKQLETQWEFQSEDALSVVDRVIARGQEIVESPRLREYDAYPSARERQRNAQSALFPLGREGVHLAVYAKSMTRLRFEVRHNRNPRTLYGHKPEVQALRTDRRENLFLLIAHINEEATERLNAFLAELARQDIRPSPTITRLSVFLSHVANACGHTPALVQRVLSPLVRHGRISRNGPREVLDALDYLVEAGVLRRARPGRRARSDNLVLSHRFSEVVERTRGELR